MQNVKEQRLLEILRRIRAFYGLSEAVDGRWTRVRGGRRQKSFREN